MRHIKSRRMKWFGHVQRRDDLTVIIRVLTRSGRLREEQTAYKLDWEGAGGSQKDEGGRLEAADNGS